MARKSDDAYAKNQRRIRSLQPKESSEKAHAQARRVLARAAQQENSLKLTMPGRGGKELHVREEGVGVRPTLLTEDALLSDYLHRLRLANERLGDDFWLHGVLPHPDGPRLVVSQRHIKGEAPGADEVAGHFAEAGFVQVNAKTFYQPERNLLVSDAHVGNVLRTSEGVAPFDGCVQQPRDALLRAVQPAPALRFDDWGDDDGQAGLEF